MCLIWQLQYKNVAHIQNTRSNSRDEHRTLSDSHDFIPVIYVNELRYQVIYRFHPRPKRPDCGQSLTPERMESSRGGCFPIKLISAIQRIN